MKKFLFLTSLFIFTAYLTVNAEEKAKTEVKVKTEVSAKNSEKPAEQKTPVVGEKAPNFSAKTIRKGKFDLTGFEGKIIVLEWTNLECPFVRKHYDSKNMQNLQKKYTELKNDKGENQVVWVSIVSSARGKQGYLSSNKDAVKAFEKVGSNASQIIRDVNGSIGKLYQAKTTPTLFVIDGQGNLAYAGAVDSIASADSEDLKKAENYVAKAIDELLAGKKVTTPVTESYGCSVKY
jgi:peroxiredoxin